MTASEIAGAGLLLLILAWSVAVSTVTTKMIRERKRRLSLLGRTRAARDKYAAIFDDEFLTRPVREMFLVRLFLIGLQSETTRPLPEPRRSTVVADIERRQTVAASIAPTVYAIGGVVAIPTGRWLARAWSAYSASDPQMGDYGQFLTGAYWSFSGAFFAMFGLVMSLFVAQGLLARTATRLTEIAESVKTMAVSDAPPSYGALHRFLRQVRTLSSKRLRRGTWQRG